MLEKPVNNERLLSLDILRGITIAGMILVNNPGSWQYVYAPLCHARWNGLTPTDLVFPFFMFIMGISTCISLSKFNFEPSRKTLLKILKRTIVIFMIGLGITWLALSFQTFHGLNDSGLSFFNRFCQSITHFENLRILGVLQRLALSYGVAAWFAVSIKHNYIPYITGATLFAYSLLLLFGKGFTFSEENIISMVDRAVLGDKHLLPTVDPEGLLSTIPSICHVLIGFCCGKMILTAKDNREKMIRLFFTGTALAFTGFLFSYGCPINKKIWSPTFVLVTCGMASAFLALLIGIIDVGNHKKGTVFFESFGVNPLFIYVLAAVLSILSDNIRFTYTGNVLSVRRFVYTVVLQPGLGNYLGSLMYALLFVMMNWGIGNLLYKKRIYIKI